MFKLIIIFFILIQGVLLPGNLHAQWQQTATPPTFASCLAMDSLKLFAGDNPGVLYTTNNGTSWVNVSNGFPNNYTTSIVTNGTDIFASVMFSGIFRSTNNGNSWTTVNNGLSNLWIQTLKVIGSYIFAGNVASYGMYRSSNNGAVWYPVNTGLGASPNVYSIFYKDSTIFAGTDGGVYTSTNNGDNWTYSSTGLPAGNLVRSFISIGQYIFAGLIVGNSGSVYVSVDNGASWSYASNGIGNNYVLSLASSGSNIFAAASIGGVFLSTNYGNSWSAINDGLPSGVKSCIAVKGSNVFTGITNHGVWKRPLSELITSVTQTSFQPKGFTLEQNYPNPFNPATKIGFTLLINGNVTLKVFDITGKEVAVLLNGFRHHGTYFADFDGSKFGSGIYFYMLKTSDYEEVKKMVLIK